MYPLFLTPALKDYLWGGNRLPAEYGYQSDLEKVAEAWVLSCHPQGASTVVNGDLTGKTLSEVLNEWGAGALGTNSDAFDRFPLLIKFIDARDRLSVQVHPDDEYGLRVEGEYGKTEMWYVLDCEPGAKLIYGVNQNLTKEEFRARITDNTLEEVCRFVPVKKGDVFFIPAGTLHAIGAGILIAEVQQNSATTYRVSDYGRLGADGKPRELHIEKAIDVTSLTPSELSVDGLSESADENGRTVLLAKCRYFTAELWEIDGVRSAGDQHTFQSLLCLDGGGTLICDGKEWPVKKGDSVFLPAGLSAEVKGKLNLLCSYV